MATHVSKTSTGDAPADPYTVANRDDSATLEDKIKDLVKFMDKCRFAMMTTRSMSNGALYSRCMALAATVRAVKSAVEILLLNHTVLAGLTKITTAAPGI